MRKRVMRLGAMVIALSAAATSAHAVELLQPAPHSTLRGGSFAPLEISLRALPPGAEEWEAFLSIDGGAHYDVRVTPHLDLAIDRYTWLVPNVDASDARILIRTGDERHETILEIPRSFSIRRDRRARLSAPVWLSREQPEAARPGDAPVLAWAEGDRSGNGDATVAAVSSGKGWCARTPRTKSSLSVDGTPRSVFAPSGFPRSLAFHLPSFSRADLSAAFSRLDVLLTCRRLNL